MTQKKPPARITTPANFVCSLPILVRRITAHTRDGEEIWGAPIAAFQYVRDAEAFVEGKTNPGSHVIVQDVQGVRRVTGHDGHGYAIHEALDRAAGR
jgi:hypothetical protein